MVRRMTNVRKTIGLPMVLILLLILGMTCSAVAAPKVTLEWWTHNWGDAFGDWIQATIESFEAKNPDVKIKWVDVKEINETYLTAAIGGQAPDVFLNYGPQVFTEKGLLLDLTPYLTEDVKAGFIDMVWTLEEPVTGDGFYAVPFYTDGPPPLWYNKEILADAGIDLEKGLPSNDFELLDMSVKIHQATGKYGFAFKTSGWGNYGPMRIFQSHDLDIFQDGNINLASDEAVEILEKWVWAYQNGGIPPEATTGVSRDDLNWFLEERAAMVMLGGWICRYFPPSFTEERLGVTLQPRGRSGKVWGSPYNWWSVSAGSKHPKEAVDFAIFLATDPGVVVAWTKAVGAIIPMSKAAFEDPYFTAAPQTWAEKARGVQAEMQMNWPVMPNVPLVSNWVELKTILKEKVDQAFAGQITARKALEEAEKEWELVLGY
jgi:putative chitobiose transport system substrate-binding protein